MAQSLSLPLIPFHGPGFRKLSTIGLFFRRLILLVYCTLNLQDFLTNVYIRGSQYHPKRGSVEQEAANHFVVLFVKMGKTQTVKIDLMRVLLKFAYYRYYHMTQVIRFRMFGKDRIFFPLAHVQPLIPFYKPRQKCIKNFSENASLNYQYCYISLVDFLKAARASLLIQSSKAAAFLDGGLLHLYTNKRGSSRYYLSKFANFTKWEHRNTRLRNQEPSQ